MYKGVRLILLKLLNSEFHNITPSMRDIMSFKANITFHSIPHFRKHSDEDIRIYYDLVTTPFGYGLIGVQDNKICYLSFQDDDTPRLDGIKMDWPRAVLIHDPNGIKDYAKLIFEGGPGNIDVLVKGTELQVNVWKELCRIKSGTTVSYGKVAELVGKPRAIRPVARAIATNRIAYLIPCHRVIKKNGDLHKYGGGAERKEKMLKYEGAI